jgi:hypothetical protein
VIDHSRQRQLEAGRAARKKQGPAAAAPRRSGVIEFDLDREHSILHVRPKGALEEADFTRLASAVDPYIEATRGLSGLIVETQSFPGWNSFAAMVAHFRFVRDHHRHIRKVAVVTDSALGDVAPRLASHFVSAEIRHFPAGSQEAAKQWILS